MIFLEILGYFFDANFLEDFNREISIRDQWNGVMEKTAKLKSWNIGSLLSLGPSSKSLAKRQVCCTQICFLHWTFQLPLGHLVLHSNTLKAKHSNACWTFLCQVSSTLFFLLIWQGKLYKVSRMLTRHLPHSLLQSPFRIFWILLSRTNVNGIS